MRMLATIVVFVIGCHSTSTPKTLSPVQPTTSQPTCVENVIDIDPILRESKCFDEARKCLDEAPTASLHDPLGAYTPEQERLIAYESCARIMRECQINAWNR